MVAGLNLHGRQYYIRMMYIYALGRQNVNSVAANDTCQQRIYALLADEIK